MNTSDRLFPDAVYLPRKGETEDQLETRLHEPVRVGRYFCSPRCGSRCTWTDHQLANKNAAAICALLGPGWTPRVWESGGWHYQAQKAEAEVHAHGRKGEPTEYSVWLQTEVGSIGGGIKAMMQIILDVPRKRDGDNTSNIRPTLRRALALKRKAAMQLLAEADAVEA